MDKETMPSIQDKMRSKFSDVPSADVKRMFLVELSKITPNPDQPRKTFNEDSLRELANNIQEYGQIQPIVLKLGNNEDTYILAAGERRYRAHQLLGKTHIYAVLTDGGVDEIALIENIQREDLPPLELAESLARLMEKHSWNQPKLAETIGKKRTTVNELLRLNQLPEEIKEKCRTFDTDAISKSLLLQIARLDDPQQQLDVWKQALKGVITTVQHARDHRQTRSSSEPSSLTDPVLKSAKAFIKRLGAVMPQDLNEDDRYQLVELKKQINDLLDRLI
jgi:ParB family transcriptional regulator, chromosome partitioning protein